MNPYRLRVIAVLSLIAFLFLGLAIVKHVLDRHGARLEIKSRPGEGSTFRCIFPESLIIRKEFA